MLLNEIVPLFEPKPRQSTQRWCRENIVTEHGRPYDHDAYPHLGAPGGPFDAFDDPKIRVIWLKFATRLGKTFFGEACQIAMAALDPCPMMSVSADKKLAGELIERTRKMIERSPLADQLIGTSEDYIALKQAEWHVGWSTSINTLADKQVKIGHGSEIDKYPFVKMEARAKEADPLRLFLERGKDIPTYKFILECSPTEKGKSRVDRGYVMSDARRFVVPCPRCRRYQELRFSWRTMRSNQQTKPGGRFVWDHLENGRSDPDLAERTARYECEHCTKPIYDHHRPGMMRAGVWVPAGCDIEERKARKAAEARREDPDSQVEYLTGTPLRQGSNAGFQLASWYALSLRNGQIARAFIEVKDKPRDLQNFVNSWAGEVWEPLQARQTWEELGRRLIVDVGPERVPRWGVKLTAAVDKQDDRYVWVVVAWGPDRTAHLVAYGECHTLEEVADILGRPWPYEDEGELRAYCTLIDSGFRPRDVAAFCRLMQRKGLPVYPCKGSSQPLDTTYKKSKQGADSATPGLTLIRVDTRTTQDWIDNVLHTLTPADAGGLSIYHASLSAHQDLLEQLLNDQAVADLDQHNMVVESWDRVDAEVPNDYRDAMRYAYVGMLLHTRGAAILPRHFPVKTAQQLGEGKRRFTMPDGRPYLVTER